MRASKLTAAAVLSLFVVSACGATGGSPTTAPAATTPGGAATPAATSAAGQPTAAGGGATTAPVGGTADPCTLLTQADIKTATGVDYGAGVNDGYGNCTWHAGTATVNDGKGQVNVAFATAGTTLAFIKSSFSGGVDTTVSGHPAYWNPGEGLKSIWVDLGTSVLVVSIDPVPSDGQAVAQHLAELAVAKI